MGICRVYTKSVKNSDLDSLSFANGMPRCPNCAISLAVGDGRSLLTISTVLDDIFNWKDIIAFCRDFNDCYR